jgi:VIT1/CCC1 family predicted Fe2+/Mn2+ transporter
LTKSDNNSPHLESHKSHRAAWLRAAVLGVNDGIVSTSSLMLGVLAATEDSRTILTAGIAGLVAGALSMAAGEYVSVYSQRDSEIHDLNIEKKSIKENPEAELTELAEIYESRGLDKKLARQVAVALHENDALGAHARDELGIDHEELARPLQAAVASALSFSVGASVPIIASLLATHNLGGVAITVSSLVALAISGAIGATIGGGNRFIAATRVLLGGGAAMAITYFIGHIIGLSV